MTSIVTHITATNNNISIIEAIPFEIGVVRFAYYPGIEEFKNNEFEFESYLPIEYLKTILQVFDALA